MVMSTWEIITWWSLESHHYTVQLMFFVSVLLWHITGDRWISRHHPSPRAWTWRCWRVSRVYLLFWRATSWGTTPPSEGKDNEFFTNPFIFPLLISNVRHGFLLVSCIGSMGWQGSMGTTWAWTSLWKIWLCWRFCCSAWCWPLSSGWGSPSCQPPHWVVCRSSFGA